MTSNVSNVAVMEKYRNEFNIKFAYFLQDNLKDLQDLQKDIISRLWNSTSLFRYFGVSLLGFLPGRNEREYHLKIHFVAYIITVIVMIATNIYSKNKFYQTVIKEILYPNLLNLFGEKIFYKCADTNYIGEDKPKNQKFKNLKLSVMEKFAYSQSKYAGNAKIKGDLYGKSGVFTGLIPKYISIDDIIFGEHAGVGFAINEVNNLAFYVKDKFAKGGKRETEEFSGIVMHFKLNKKIKSRVIITSKSSSLTTKKMYDKVFLEDPIFSKKYNVYVPKEDKAGQIEARYLLTTVFMERFNHIKTSFKVSDIKCSVNEDDMLIFLYTNKDLFELNHLFKRIDDIKQYEMLFNEFSSVLAFIDVLNLSDDTGL